MIDAETPRLSPTLQRIVIDAVTTLYATRAVELSDANAAAQRCGIREGETLAELIKRLYDETLNDD